MHFDTGKNRDLMCRACRATQRDTQHKRKCGGANSLAANS